MKPADLHAVWSAPDNSRITAKQSSFRLPVHVAAKLAALCELYPSKTRTQIVGDLLAAAIDANLEGLPSVKGRILLDEVDYAGEPIEIYEEAGILGRFKELANKHFIELERDLGNEALEPLYPYEFVRESHDEPVATFTFDERRAK